MTRRSAPTPTLEGFLQERYGSRNAAILRRYQDGENMARIGASLGLTRDRVRQIVKASGADMPQDYVCAVEACDTAPHWPNSYCCMHQKRFERYGDPTGTRSLLKDQHGTYACYSLSRCKCDPCRRANAEQKREREHRLHPEMRRYQTSPAAGLESHLPTALVADEATDSRGTRAVQPREVPAVVSGIRAPETFGRTAALRRRNFDIINRYANGESWVSIARRFGITTGRVRQVLKQAGCTMPRDGECLVEGCRATPRHPATYCSKHQARLERFGDPLSTREQRRVEHGTITCYEQGGCRCELCRRAEAERSLEYRHRIHPESRTNLTDARRRVLLRRQLRDLGA
jgi:hypothetical protein